MNTPADRLREQLVTFRSASRSEPPEHDPIDLRPASAFEAITRQMVESLSEELSEIKGRLNGLIFMMVGAILLEIISRMVSA